MSADAKGQGEDEAKKFTKRFEKASAIVWMKVDSEFNARFTKAVHRNKTNAKKAKAKLASADAGVASVDAD